MRDKKSWLALRTKLANLKNNLLKRRLTLSKLKKKLPSYNQSQLEKDQAQSKLKNKFNLIKKEQKAKIKTAAKLYKNRLILENYNTKMKRSRKI